MAFLLLFAVRDGTNELLGKRLFFKPDLGWMVKCPKREITSTIAEALSKWMLRRSWIA
ncbi:MAG: hypothetical protein HON70_05900 [Lentisphaerae bacterium]|nr:hypothetical protein [Lentisphaerota bacterium]